MPDANNPPSRDEEDASALGKRIREPFKKGDDESNKSKSSSGASAATHLE
jgi:hypothetical protein